MSKIQAFARNVKEAVQRTQDEFFRLKTRKEDFNYLPMTSALPLDRKVGKVELSRNKRIGATPVTLVEYKAVA